MEERDNAVISAFVAAGDCADVLRLFSRPTGNPGYFVLGCWALRISQQYIKSSAVIKNWGSASSPLHAVVVNEALSKEIIRDSLLHLGVSVEVYERNGSAYRVAQQGTPGNIADFEATLFEFGDAEVQLMSCGAISFHVSGSQIRVGLAVLNATLRTIMVAEFDDVLQLVNLDSHVAQCNLRELLVPVSSALGEFEEALKRLCERANVTINTLAKKSTACSVAEVQRKISGILRSPEEKFVLVDVPLSAVAVGYLLDHAKISEATDHATYSLKHILSTTFAKLDAAAIHALNLVAQGQQEAPRGKIPNTIFGWLNRCVTGMGSRLMRQWLLQPLRDVDAISARHTLLEIMVESPIVRDALSNQVLRRCSDMDRMNRKLQRRTISLKELHGYLNFVTAVGNSIRCLKLYTGQHVKLLSAEVITPLEELGEHLGNLKLLIEYTIDVADRVARIKPEFDDELNNLDQQRQNVLNSIDKEHTSAMRKYGWNDKQLKCELHTSYGYVFRVSRKDDQQVRESKELTTINTSKDGVRFASEKLLALSEQYRQVSKGYQSRQQDLKSKLVDTVATYLPVLDDSKELIAQLDVFVAWSLVVADSRRPMTRPIVRAASSTTLLESGGTEPTINFVNLRHPLVELRRPDFIPNSIKLSNDVTTYMITGPNMGGKSTLMRSAGVAVVLAQAGCFVPADHAELIVRDAVMCRVGATDHMSQGVSTFMVEMLESAAILSTATKYSFVIIDELGRGTSTYDGFGLAWAIADYISNTVKASLLFSTHFHEMTDMESVSSSVKNVHFGAESLTDGSLRFTYKLEPGACERSYGIYVAEMAKLPPEVIDDAKRKAEELESFAGKTEQWRRMKLDASAQQRVTAYVARLREASLQHNEESLEALCNEIKADAEIANILFGASA